MHNGALQKTPGQRPRKTEEAQTETAMRGSTVPCLLRIAACVDCVFLRVDALATVIERSTTRHVSVNCAQNAIAPNTCSFFFLMGRKL